MCALKQQITEKPFFNLGHIFKASELPEDKLFLDGALVIKKDDNGTMLVVSPEQLGDLGNYRANLVEEIETLNQNGVNARIGNKCDWETLLSSQFAEKTGIVNKAYWKDGYETIIPDTAHKNYANAFISKPRTMKSCEHQAACGRWFADVPEFDPE